MAFALAVLELCTPSVAIADQPESSDSEQGQQGAEVEKVEQQARAFFKVGAFLEAAREFERAYELGKKPSNLFNAGLAYEKQSEWQDASRLYGLYLAVESDGERAVEARARKLAVDKRIAELKELQKQEEARKAAQAAEDAHTSAAFEHLGKGNYVVAAEEFAKAFEKSKNPERLFDRAEALRLGTLTTEALAAYQRYRRLAPDGLNAALADRRLNELMQSAPGRGPDMTANNSSLVGATSSGTSEPEANSGLSWLHLGLGMGALAAGVAVDLLPDSASNGRFDALDLAPIALYGLGAGLVYRGVF